MAKLNTKVPQIHTHEGAVASHINAEQQLRRSVMSCLLWESEFYEDGQSIAGRIQNTIPLVKPEIVAQIAKDARGPMKLRHVPLLIARTMAALPKHKALVANVLADIIQRPDELAEFLAIYWKEKKAPLSAQVKKGLARSFQKFDAYALSKWNKDGAIKLRDVLFLCHAKPKDEAQAALWKQLVDGTLPIPDTWEVALSAGNDKKTTWERLLSENKLGALALLRNLRNMQDVGVDREIIKTGLEQMKVDRVLPFRFIAAAKYAPNLEPFIEPAMLKCASSLEKIRGNTALLVDHSGSMRAPISQRSEITRFDAAGALGIILREICIDDFRLFTFSDNCVEVAPRRGFAMIDAVKYIINPQWTLLGKAVDFVYSKFPECERLIVITDEQSADKPRDPQGRGYIINVASAQNGIGYGAWNHIDGFSEAVLDYIRVFESTE